MRTIGRALAVTTLALALLAPVAGASLGAKTGNPCKLLKQGEISDALGQPVAAPEKGILSGAAADCAWDVTAAGAFPDGSFSTFIQKVGAKVAYDANSKLPAAEPVPELGKAYYDTTTGALTVLKGKKLLVVQGAFISTEGGLHTIDRRAELIELAKLALKRL